jgi:CheY-like chemotaxis protein
MSPGRRSTPLILLADDDDLLRNMLLRYLEEAGYAVLPAADGGEALRFLATDGCRIRLVVTDFEMPHASGQEVAAAARAMGRPVILMSGSPRPAEAGEGCWDYIAKPFRPEQLLQAVAGKLGEGPGPASPRPTVILAEDDAAARSRLSGLLSTEYEVAAFAEGASVIARAEQIRPEAILLDIVMPGLNGFAVARTLHRSMPGVPLLFITQHSEPAYVEEAFASGAAGYVLKGRAALELIPALREVRAGGRYLSPDLRQSP